MKLARPFLLPFSPLYWLITTFRNWFFDLGILKSKSFNMPIIAIGNLNAGGTGKTPHTEYVARYVSQGLDKYTAILSRGYGRISSGIQVVELNSLPLIVGDEPAQLKKRLPECAVVADGNRVRAVKTMLQWPKVPEAIILDDAFQHRHLKAGHYVLLTAFNDLYTDDLLLPGGNLRERRSGAKRADTIIVTKCPLDMSTEEQQSIQKGLKLNSDQQVFFTCIDYAEPIQKHNIFDFEKPFVLVTGIANFQPLLDYLQSIHKTFHHIPFPDHHEFTDQDIERILEKTKAFDGQLLTTEKDIQRFSENVFIDSELKAAYIPISVRFLEDEEHFKASVKKFVEQF